MTGPCGNARPDRRRRQEKLNRIYGDEPLYKVKGVVDHYREEYVPGFVES